ncbi:MAG: VanZ family protein [Faecalibacillus sp.]
MKNKKLTLFIFSVYLLLLSWLILMKLLPSFDLLPHMRSLNLIPFRETLFINNKINFKDIIYNILAFVPLGVYLKIFFKKWPIWKIVVTGLIVSLSFETIQYLFAIGCSDITDLITNTTGTLIGIDVYSLFDRYLQEKTVTVINMIGLMIEILALILATLLFLFNS